MLTATEDIFHFWHIRQVLVNRSSENHGVCDVMVNYGGGQWRQWVKLNLFSVCKANSNISTITSPLWQSALADTLKITWQKHQRQDCYTLVTVVWVERWKTEETLSTIFFWFMDSLHFCMGSFDSISRLLSAFVLSIIIMIWRTLFFLPKKAEIRHLLNSSFSLYPNWDTENTLAWVINCREKECCYKRI